MTQTFAQHLRARHIRPSDLARTAGFNNSSTIANWLEGDVLSPYRPNVEKVAQALGVSTDDLFDMIAEGYYQKNPSKREQPDPSDLIPAA